MGTDLASLMSDQRSNTGLSPQRVRIRPVGSLLGL